MRETITKDFPRRRKFTRQNYDDTFFADFSLIVAIIGRLVTRELGDFPASKKGFSRLELDGFELISATVSVTSPRVRGEVEIRANGSRECAPDDRLSGNFG